MYRIFLLFLCIVPGLGWAQDPEFSQFFANPLYINPAFAGTTELPRMVVNYRNQWPDRGSTYQTYSISFDKLSEKHQSGFGFQLLHDRELTQRITTSHLSTAYSHHIKLHDENFITMGLQAGIVLKQFDAGNLIFPSGIDQLSGRVSEKNPYGFTDEKKVFPDFAVGLAGQHRELYWGTSIHHLTQPDESVMEGDQKGKLPAKITLYAGSLSRRLHHGLLSREFTLSPNLIYQQQGGFRQLSLGVYLIERSFLIGTWYRNNLDIRPDAVIFLAGLATENFRLGYSFDLTLSKLSHYSYGSHEISLALLLGIKKGLPPKNKLLIPMI